MRAMVLSAGYGTRLWPLTEDRTKPAIPILGKPLVGYVAEYLAGHGIDEIVVNLHHRPESVRKALGDGSSFGVKLHYVEEPVILGTSGAVDNARDFFLDETFVVVNGKIIVPHIEVIISYGGLQRKVQIPVVGEPFIDL